MSVLMITFIRIHDLESYNREYLAVASPIAAKYGAKVVIASEDVQVLEGDFPQGRVVILEFPSKEQAEAFYSDPDHEPLKEVLNKYSDNDSAIVEKGTGPAL